MTQSSYLIVPERPADSDIIEHLNETAFGPGRFTLTAYRVREQAHVIPELCFAAWQGETCIGSIRHALISVNGERGLLLGPLVVHPDHKNRGCGIALIEHALKKAVELGYRWVILVSDEPYYRRVGFQAVPFGAIMFPGPVDPARILLRPLQSDQAVSINGLVVPIACPNKSAAFAEPCGGEGAKQKQKSNQTGK